MQTVLEKTAYKNKNEPINSSWKENAGVQKLLDAVVNILTEEYMGVGQVKIKIYLWIPAFAFSASGGRSGRLRIPINRVWRCAIVCKSETRLKISPSLQ